MKGALAWVGKEVEGRLFGIETLFLRSLSNTVMSDRRVIEHFDTLGHVYLTAEVQDSHTVKEVECFVEKCRVALKYVTLECLDRDVEKLSTKIRDYCHLIVRVHVSCLHLLKNTDSIALDIHDPPAYECFVFSKQAALVTTRDQYTDDELLV